jgi:drug/metabolite transporter (DMT)-like permease
MDSSAARAAPVSPETALELASAERRKRLAGIGLMCGALLCFSFLDATAKWLNREIDPLLTIWWRYMSSIVLVAAFINPWTKPGVLRTRRPWLQAIRSLLLFASTAANFFALRYLQLAETMSIIFATPLLVALLAVPLLGERIGPRRLAAIIVGFVGVLVITRPGLGTMHPAALLSLAGAVAYALYAIATKLLAGSDSAQTTLTYSGVAGVVILTPFLPMFWVTPASPFTWALLVALGAFGAVGHYFLILAHARAPAAILSPFIYSQIVWMLALGFILFGDWPDAWTLAGSGIVIASGLYLLSRERARSQRP